MMPPESFMDERGLFRPGLQVPKDQRNLLDQRDAWAELMRRTPQGLLNVPPHVLDTLKALHAQKVSFATAVTSTPEIWAEPMSKTPQGLVNVPPHILDGLAAFHAQTSAFATAVNRSPEASILSQEPSTEEPMPWSPSPPRNINPRRTAATPSPMTNRFMSQANDAGSPSDVPISDWSPSPPRNHHFLRGAAADRTASPQGRIQALPSSTATKSSLQMSRKDSCPGPSSKQTARSIAQPSSDEHESPPMQRGITSSPNDADSEDDHMSVEAPLALSPSFQKSINKTAAPVAPTPPSAQIMSLTDQKNHQHQQPRVKRRKMKNALGLLDKCLGKISDCENGVPEVLPSRLTLPAKRLSETKTSVLRQSSRELRSPEALALSQAPQSEHEPTQHDSRDTKIAKHASHASDHSAPDSAAVTEVPQQSELAPFEVFRKNYPDFTGSLNSFLRACLSLNWLAKSCSLKAFLFDDFVRVYCHKYMEFVAFLDPAPRAIDYYNKDETPPMYLNGVINTPFLMRIEAVYSEEIALLEACNSVEEPLEAPHVRSEQASINLENDKPNDVPHTDDAEEHAGVEDATPHSPSQPLLPEEAEVFDVEDDRFYRSSRVASPDLGTPTSDNRWDSTQQGDTKTTTTSGALYTGAILDLACSTASEVIIPNTSISVLDANPLRIPETVHKPRPRQVTQSAKQRPFRLIASLGNRDSPTSSMSSSQRKRRFSEYLARSGQSSKA